MSGVAGSGCRLWAGGVWGMGMGMGVGWGEECGSGVVVVVVDWTRWVRAVWGVWVSMGQYGAVWDSGGRC